MSTAPSPTVSPAPASPPPAPMRTSVRIAFGLYLMLLNATLVFVLISVWPDGTSQTTSETLHLFWNKLSFSLSVETRYLLIVAISGALGSYIHTATSFADFVGNRRLYASWTWWYLLRPFIGMALALIVYFAVRGGLIGASTGANVLSPFGIAAIAGLAGMFSKQATDKLREVFETLFKTDQPPERKDRLTG